MAGSTTTSPKNLRYDVLVTNDGQQFIEAYDGFQPTAIILGMIMPGMDGNEIVLWLAQQKCTKRLIIITGYTPDYASMPRCWRSTRGSGQ